MSESKKNLLALLSMIFGIISAAINAFLFAFGLFILFSEYSDYLGALAITCAVAGVGAMAFTIVARVLGARGGKWVAGLITSIIGLAILTVIGFVVLGAAAG